MEKKKLQRVIGISVVVAFVIVLIPFLFGKKEMPQQETTAQITPEQQSATTIADTTQTTTTTDGTQATTVQDNSAQMNPTDATNNANAPAPTANTPTSNAEENGITPITNTPPVATTDPNATPVSPSDTTTTTTPTQTTNGETMSAVNPAATDTKAPSTTAATNSPATTSNSDDSMQAVPAVSTDANDATRAQVSAEKTAALAPVHEVKARHIHNKLAAKKVHHTLAKNVDTNKPAWVVQMGNFKDKSNANRMVSQLKSSGYKAFTRVVTSPSGTVRTRVYIGPESKQASAQQLTTKVQREMKLQGFVLPYKAIAL